MKKIAVMCGGDSSERQVSAQSALNVMDHIDREKYLPRLVFIEGINWYVLPSSARTLEDILVHSGCPVIDKNRFSFQDPETGKEEAFDTALIMIHGTPGENGLLQGYLEMQKIPFTTCSSFVSAITFDKHSCKRFLDFAGVKMADDIFISCNRPYSVREIILKECGTILAEEAVSGREVTCGAYKFNGRICALPVTEIVTDREFFDFEAKYLGESQEICPARISETLTSKIQNLTESIYSYMGCRGIVRMDYIITEKEDIYFLEVNTVPGMTKMSLVPNMLRTAGIDIKDFITSLIEEAGR